MRFLKNKLLKAQEARRRQITKQCNPKSSEIIDDRKIIIMKIEEDGSSIETFDSPNDSPKLQSRRTPKTFIEADNISAYESHKNIAINYGKAIATFAASHIAIPYLEAILRKQEDCLGLTIAAFQRFVRQRKNKIAGVSSLRSLLLVTDEDNKEAAKCKRLFQATGEVFIKYFSVNWIMTGKLVHKLVYLKFRTKMLKKIQNPNSFISIREKAKRY